MKIAHHWIASSRLKVQSASQETPFSQYKCLTEVSCAHNGIQKDKVLFSHCYNPQSCCPSIILFSSPSVTQVIMPLQMKLKECIIIVCKKIFWCNRNYSVLLWTKTGVSPSESQMEKKKSYKYLLLRKTSLLGSGGHMIF